MESFNESHNSAGQSSVNVKNTQKHDVNLPKNAMLYLQLGLIICLFAVYGLLEMKFETKNFVIVQPPQIDNTGEIDIKNFKVYQEEPKAVEPIKNVQKLGTTNPVIKPDDFNGMEINKVIISEPQTTNLPIDPGSIKINKVIEDIPVPWNALEKVPIYPGCESAKTNDKRKKCMSEKITELIQKRFNTSLAMELGLSGVQKIDVEFKIDKTGTVTDIKTRAPFSQLENEAQRIVKKIPIMKPGMQRDQPVSVLCYFPIIFKVQ
jgi:protein TonB